MADLPPIFSLMMGAVLGDLGPRAEVADVRRCPAEWPHRVVTLVDYRLDLWNGEDLLEARGQYAVSERLRCALEEANVRGVEFKEMVTSTAPGFAIADDAYARTLPRFHWMVITGEADGPEIWSRRSACPQCGGPFWSLLPAGFEAGSWPRTRGPLPAREVYRDAWKDDDVFYPGDHILPLISARFAAVLERLATPVLLQPARWVDRE